MISNIIYYIQPIILNYGALGVFLATILENVITIIPAPLIPLAAGFFLLPTNGMVVEIIWRVLIYIALPVSLGMIIMSFVFYWLGHWGGKPFIEKFHKFIGFNWNDLERTKNKLFHKRYDEITLFILRLSPIFPSSMISIICGIIRYPLKTFIIITFLGTFIRTIALGIIGWQAGIMYTIYSDMIDNAENTILIVLISIFFVFLLLRFLKKKQK